MGKPEKSKDEKLLEAIFSPQCVAEAHYREFREHALAIAKDFVSPVDSFKFTGIDADKDKLIIYYYDEFSGMAGSVTIREESSYWEYEDAVKLPSCPKVRACMCSYRGCFCSLLTSRDLELSGSKCKKRTV